MIDETITWYNPDELTGGYFKNRTALETFVKKEQVPVTIITRQHIDHRLTGDRTVTIYYLKSKKIGSNEKAKFYDCATKGIIVAGPPRKMNSFVGEEIVQNYVCRQCGELLYSTPLVPAKEKP